MSESTHGVLESGYSFAKDLELKLLKSFFFRPQGLGVNSQNMSRFFSVTACSKINIGPKNGGLEDECRPFENR